MLNIRRWFQSDSMQYAALDKKDDDLFLKEKAAVEIWMKSYPVNPHLSYLKNWEIENYVSLLMKDLSKITLNERTIEDISSHLQNIAQQSDRARKNIIGKCSNLKCDKDIVNQIWSGIILTCSSEA